MVIFGKYFIFKPYSAYGNRAEDMLYAALKSKRENLILCLFYNPIKGFRFRMANNALCKKVKSKEIRIIVIPVIFLYIIHLPHAIIRTTGLIISKFINKKIGHLLISLSDHSIGRRYLYGDLGQQQNYLDKTIDWPSEISNSNNKPILNYTTRGWLENKIPELAGRKYVCLHVRTGQFHKDDYYGAPRNFTFRNMIKSINYLAGRGYLVVRVGAEENEWIKIEGCINLDTKIKDGDLLDIGVIEHCDYYIGGYSGPMDVALLFNKKILGINLISLGHCCWYTEGSRFVSKKIVKDGRILSIEEQIKEHHFEITGTGRMNSKSIFIENSEDEILAGVTELINESNLTNEQLRINDLIKKEFVNYINGEQIWAKKEDDTLQKMRWRSKLEGVNGGVVLRG